MFQAEIRSARVTAAESFPTGGHLMPDFTLSSSDGNQVSLYDYRGRSNLVLFFDGGRIKHRADGPLLSALAKRYGEIAKTDSEVVVVLAESVAQADEFRRKMHFPFPALSGFLLISNCPRSRNSGRHPSKIFYGDFRAGGEERIIGWRRSRVLPFTIYQA